jgi:hypothetical protein
MKILRAVQARAERKYSRNKDFAPQKPANERDFMYGIRQRRPIGLELVEHAGLA